MPTIVWPGTPGETYSNTTGQILYQLVCSWTNTCGVCASYHLAIAKWWGKFHHGCLLPGTRVVAPGAVAGFVAGYHGDAYRITLSDGTTFAVTANHMLLTPGGFLKAKSLVKGDHVIQCTGREGVVFGAPDEDRRPAPIEDVIRSLAMSPGVQSRSVEVSPEDLHGDGTLCDGQIHVVTADGELPDDLDPDPAQADVEAILQRTDRHPSRLPAVGDPLPVLLGLRDATDGGMGGLREAKAALLAESRHMNRSGLTCPPDWDSIVEQDSPYHRPTHPHADRHGEFTLSGLIELDDFRRIGRLTARIGEPALAGISNLRPRFSEPIGDDLGRDAHRFRDAVRRFSGRVTTQDLAGIDRSFAAFPQSTERHADLRQPQGHDLAGDVQRLRDVVHRFPGQVATLEIIGIERVHYSGPVYDVQTTSSLYLIGNGVTSSNCNCRSEPVYPNKESRPYEDWHGIVDALPPDQRTKLVGASNMKLIDAGVVKWNDVVTSNRVRLLREVVSRSKLSLNDLTDVGIRKDIAERAHASVNTPDHILARQHRQELVKQLLDLGLPPRTIAEAIAQGLTSRIGLGGHRGGAGPGAGIPGVGPQTMPPAGRKRDEWVRLVLGMIRPPTPRPGTTPKPAPKPEPTPGPAPPVNTIAQFAEQAVAAAWSVPEDQRVGGDRVWISDAFRQFKGLFPGASIADFKDRLIDANRERLITLARNDMPQTVPAADRGKILASEVEQGLAVFHWIRLLRKPR